MIFLTNIWILLITYREFDLIHAEEQLDHQNSTINGRFHSTLPFLYLSQIIMPISLKSLTLCYSSNLNVMIDENKLRKQLSLVQLEFPK